MAGPFGSQQRFNAKALQGKRIYWLLDLTFASVTYRLSRDELDVTSTAMGKVLQYNGGINNEIEWEESVDIFSDSISEIAIPLSISLDVDVAALIAQGHDLGSAYAELSLYIDGTKYEDRRVVVRGFLTDPQYGTSDEPITFSLESNGFDDRGLVPGIKETITKSTWPNAVSDAVGLSYPFVFGKQPSSGPGNVPASPAYLVSTGPDRLLIAGHIVEATNVTVYSDFDATGKAGVVCAVSPNVDGLGHMCTLVTISTTALATHYDTSSNFYVSWNRDNLGAHWNVERTGTLAGAGDLIEYLLLQSSFTFDQSIDLGRVAAAKEYLNKFRLAGYISECTSPWEYIQANILPLLPVSIVNGPNGFYPLVWKYDAIENDAVDRWDTSVDPTIERTSTVSYVGSKRDMLNDFKLSYALNETTSTTAGAVTLSAQRDDDDSYSAENLYCRVSQARYGQRSDEQETVIVYDDATAGLILYWSSRAKSLPQRTIKYLVSQERAWLERGNIITLTDSELSFNKTVCLIESIVYREDDLLEVTLRLVEDHAREFKLKK